MCGINGFTSRDPELLRRMHEATRHRGPDDEGFFETDQISFAHNRLSIIDLSPAGRQPMQIANGRYTIVFNGEIYNFRELKAELGTIEYKSTSDTEVLLHAWEKWGADCLPKLNGMFAFAIWDQEKQELVLVRDSIGIKPLYYLFQNGKLAFSSEAKGLLPHLEKREIDLDSLNLYFRFLYVPGPATMLKGIKKLQPGHLLRFKNGQVDIQEWHEVKEGEPFKNYEEARNLLRETAFDAVKKQLVSDRPVGVFLSGGVDSTAVFGMMRKFADGPVKTFSVGYTATEEEEKYNRDFLIAAETSKLFGGEHHPVIISGKDVADCFEEVVRQMDDPVSNHIQPSTYLLAKATKPEVAVALGGDGGDELFGGYERYWLSSMIDRARMIPFAEFFHEKLKQGPGVERYLSFMSQKEESVARYLKAGVNNPSVGMKAFAPYFLPQWKDATNQFMATDLQTWLPDESLIRSDKLAMAHGLEQRVPLLDIRLAEMAFRIPSKWKNGKRGYGKKILRDALHEFVPESVSSQRKWGFFSPAAKWLRTDLAPLAERILSDDYAKGSEVFIDLAQARAMLKEHQSKQAYHLNPLWAIMTFRAWWQAYMV